MTTFQFQIERSVDVRSADKTAEIVDLTLIKVTIIINLTLGLLWSSDTVRVGSISCGSDAMKMC